MPISKYSMPMAAPVINMTPETGALPYEAFEKAIDRKQQQYNQNRESLSKAKAFLNSVPVMKADKEKLQEEIDKYEKKIKESVDSNYSDYSELDGVVSDLSQDIQQNMSKGTLSSLSSRLSKHQELIKKRDEEKNPILRERYDYQIAQDASTPLFNKDGSVNNFSYNDFVGDAEFDKKIVDAASLLEKETKGWEDYGKYKMDPKDPTATPYIMKVGGKTVTLDANKIRNFYNQFLKANPLMAKEVEIRGNMDLVKGGLATFRTKDNVGSGILLTDQGKEVVKSNLKNRITDLEGYLKTLDKKQLNGDAGAAAKQKIEELQEYLVSDNGLNVYASKKAYNDTERAVVAPMVTAKEKHDVITTKSLASQWVQEANGINTGGFTAPVTYTYSAGTAESDYDAADFAQIQNNGKQAAVTLANFASAAKTNGTSVPAMVMKFYNDNAEALKSANDAEKATMLSNYANKNLKPEFREKFLEGFNTYATAKMNYDKLQTTSKFVKPFSSDNSIGITDKKDVEYINNLVDVNDTSVIGSNEYGINYGTVQKIKKENPLLYKKLLKQLVPSMGEANVDNYDYIIADKLSKEIGKNIQDGKIKSKVEVEGSIRDVDSHLESTLPFNNKESWTTADGQDLTPEQGNILSQAQYKQTRVITKDGETYYTVTGKDSNGTFKELVVKLSKPSTTVVVNNAVSAYDPNKVLDYQSGKRQTLIDTNNEHEVEAALATNPAATAQLGNQFKRPDLEKGTDIYYNGVKIATYQEKVNGLRLYTIVNGGDKLFSEKDVKAAAADYQARSHYNIYRNEYTNELAQRVKRSKYKEEAGADESSSLLEE